MNKSSNAHSDKEPLHVKGVSQRHYYDLDEIKRIPILDVCRNMLGIECVQRSGKTWCKARQERTASTLLHTDSNTFHDFGSNTHGDVISLVCHVLNTDRKTAISQLAKAYHINPVQPAQATDPYELTLSDYACIGIAGDKAIKNFTFDIDRLPIERIHALSEKYAMDMNALRRKHPKTYEKILLQKALPYVRCLRNEYYLDVWSRYQMLCSIGNPSLFFHEDQLAYFSEQIKDLKTAERVLRKAIHNTSIHLQPINEYVPAKDLEYLSEGEIKPTMGTASYHEMEKASEKSGSSVKYRSVDYDQYVKHMLGCSEELFYSAFLKSGRVIIGCLEKDIVLFQPFFQKMQSSSVSKKTQKLYKRERSDIANFECER